ncbi:hypothetical protein AMAG_03950 [Allomyces macrogynus ATCC 38327]|uniref:Tyrosinase copper-binding domain-containing protein n=1 Tax=Allomyces macrogynus (strain ATCC 38327) TaxID=578462 RepID=A0A0L0S771_ALLM3|nr:hypothetical protein AMAG_03950 [Allomyces macrogynus ATCC 38327]|eukprot:KNE58367.1 hypothetical protein AMAG_03950 [Allomyces macrogynus ATCC 38327]
MLACNSAHRPRKSRAEASVPALAVLFAVFAIALVVAATAAAATSVTTDPSLIHPPLDDGGPQANGYRVFHGAPVPANWPVVFAAVPPGLDLSNHGPAPNFQDADPNKYTWSFGQAPGERAVTVPCTVEGFPNQPCVSKVVEYTFHGHGQFHAVCTVTDPQNVTVAVLSVMVPIAAKPIPLARRKAIRREFRDWLMPDWHRYTVAVKGLRAMRVWDHVALVHANSFLNFTASTPGSNSRSVAHSSPAFLPWHRAYMRILERLMQKFLRDDAFAVPYWDWTMDARGATLNMSLYPPNHPSHEWLSQWKPSGASPISLFTDRYVGPDGDPKHHDAVPTGPFCSPVGGNPSCTEEFYIPVRFNLGSIVLQRRIGRQSGAILPTAAQVAKMMRVTEYDTAPFGSKWSDKYAELGLKSFRGLLEGWSGVDSDVGGMHNDVHQWVGGAMLNVQYAIMDPAFILHHAFVDKLFFEWQLQHQCFSADCHRPRPQDLDATIPGVEKTPNGLILRGHMFDDDLSPWRLTTRDVWLEDSTGDSILSEYGWAQPGEPRAWLDDEPVTVTEAGANATAAAASKDDARSSAAESVAVVGSLWLAAILASVCSLLSLLF